MVSSKLLYRQNCLLAVRPSNFSKLVFVTVSLMCGTRTDMGRLVEVTEGYVNIFVAPLQGWGGGNQKSWYVSTYGRAFNKFRSMKIVSRYPGNAAVSLTGSMKITWVTDSLQSKIPT